MAVTMMPVEAADIYDAPHGAFAWVKREDQNGKGVHDEIMVVMPYDEQGRHTLSLHSFPVYRKGQPKPDVKGASWEWDGNREKPTLMPSLLCQPKKNGGRGLWHGYMKAGVLEAC